MFHAEILNDSEKLNDEAMWFKEILLLLNVTQQQVPDNYNQVKIDVKQLIGEEVERLKREDNAK